MSRERTVCLMRIRNESRWIQECVRRAFQVCQTVVLWDDGSEDDTRIEAFNALGTEYESGYNGPRGDGAVTVDEGILNGKKCVLHFIESPFTEDKRIPSVRVNEIRDKRALWAYAQTATNCDVFLCLDGDEWLSNKAIREGPEVERLFEQGHDVLHLNFVYVWKVDPDGTLWQRTDGIYGPAAEGPRTLNFPRIFTTRRVTPDNFFMMTFAWLGSHSFHCGSIAQQSFVIGEEKQEPRSHLTRLEVVHWGYVDEELRQRKFEFYNTIDPHNLFEGEYRHIIGLSDVHAPGPVALAQYQDI